MVGRSTLLPAAFEAVRANIHWGAVASMIPFFTMLVLPHVPAAWGADYFVHYGSCMWFRPIYVANFLFPNYQQRW